VDAAGRKANLLDETTFKIIMDNATAINKRIDYTRDFNYDFFGFKTLEKSYLLRTANKRVTERP
jgi:ribonucleoside-diphosphate reductase subunit M1